MPKDSRVVQELQSRVQSKGNIPLEDLLLTICCGTDMVNIECKYLIINIRKSANQSKLD